MADSGDVMAIHSKVWVFSTSDSFCLHGGVKHVWETQGAAWTEPMKIMHPEIGGSEDGGQ